MNTYVASKTTLLLSAFTLCLTQFLTTPLAAVIALNESEIEYKKKSITLSFCKNSNDNTEKSPFELLSKDVLWRIFSFIHHKKDIDNCVLLSKKFIIY